MILFLLVTLGLAAWMALAWAVQCRLGNAGWVDVFWSFGTGLAGIACALIPLPGVPGPTARQLLVATLAALWSIRLGWHIAVRTAGRPEDVRYARFREQWGADFQSRMFVFLMIQALAAALLALSILVAARNPAPGPRLQDLLGVAVLAVAIGGEGIADRQMARFRADAANRGGICDRGLWRWSRHPNYFFEWLGWLAYPLLAVAPGWPWGWLALSGPVFMYWLLVHISGVPPMEREMLASRGDAFRAYQAHTSAFFPLPPRGPS